MRALAVRWPRTQDGWPLQQGMHGFGAVHQVTRHEIDSDYAQTVKHRRLIYEFGHGLYDATPTLRT